MRKHKDALSKTTIKRIIGGKYTPTKDGAPYSRGVIYNRKGEVIGKAKEPAGYIVRSDGWRRKQ